MNFISRIIKSINAMRERLKIERHEAMYGPHFNEECALKAVSKMENEDGSRGEHWSLEETTTMLMLEDDEDEEHEYRLSCSCYYDKQ